MSPPVPLSESEMRERAQMLALNALKLLRQFDCPAIAVTVSVDLADGRKLSQAAFAKREGEGG